MSSSIQDMQPGDFVKVGSNRYLEIAKVHGVSSDGKLANPSEGGFSVTAVNGRTVDMWEARAYFRKDELPAGAQVG